MVLRIFLSTAINVSEEEKAKTLQWANDIIWKEYDSLRKDEDSVLIVSNFDESPAPPDIRFPKLYHLSRALEKMSMCDGFLLLKENDGSIKPGCLVELNAWLNSCGIYSPMIWNKAWKPEGEK